jgi:hypothetical protein
MENPPFSIGKPLFLWPISHGYVEYPVANLNGFYHPVN